MTTALLANAGTPLIWAGMFQLTFGNAIIGAVEGFVLARWLRLRASSSYRS